MNLKLKERLAMSPPGGWHFIEDGTTLRADTPVELVEKIKAYRITNGRTPGDPMDDLVMFCATRWPNLVAYSDDGQPPEEDPILTSAWNWLVTISRYVNPGDVSYTQAEVQEKICSECPCNIPYTKSDDALREDFERRSFIMRKGRKSSLGFCAFHRWDNRVAIVRNRNAINAREESPSNCWMHLDLSGLRPDVPISLNGKL